MGSAPEDIAGALSRALGGTVHGLRRLSGGASRITSSFDLASGEGSVRALILQQDRGDGIGQGSHVHVEAALLRAARSAGVLVPKVVAAGAEGGLDPGWLVVERIEGETIPRKILRDPEWTDARTALTAQCGLALATIHSIDPDAIKGLPPRDPLSDPLAFLDALGEVRPALELGARWLAMHRPPSDRRVTVHGDFRMGNLLVGPDGLRAVLDWELAHAGDPAEDIGWLCARGWRFGGSGHVGGFGEVSLLLETYVSAGGEEIDPIRVTWWQVYAAVKWAVICALQASAHLTGATRSVELAAIGRRICESEWDLFALLGLTPTVIEPFPSAGRTSSSEVVSPFGRPTVSELVDAVQEYLDRSMVDDNGNRARFEARIAGNALRTVARQLNLGPAIAEAHANRLARLGYEDDAALASSIRSGHFDTNFLDVGHALAASARDQLLVANPSYLDSPGS